MMYFNNPQVRRHLLETGRVYTLRANRRRKEGPDVLVTGPRFKALRIGSGLVACVKEIRGLRPASLAPYVRGSGMPDSKSWIAAFKTFVKGPLPSSVYVYHVQLLPREVDHLFMGGQV
jgi:hypothetical protein